MPTPIPIATIIGAVAAGAKAFRSLFIRLKPCMCGSPDVRKTKEPYGWIVYCATGCRAYRTPGYRRRWQAKSAWNEFVEGKK